MPVAERDAHPTVEDMRTRRPGFSIVELTVAIIIAGILATALVVSLRPTVENVDRATAAAWADQAAQSLYSWFRTGGDTSGTDSEKAEMIAEREKTLTVAVAPDEGDFPPGQVSVWSQGGDTYIAVQGQGFCVLRRVRVSLGEGGGVTSSVVDEECHRHIVNTLDWAYREE